MNIIFWIFVGVEILIWPVGIYLMVTTNQDPETIGRAMATCIIICMIPIFIISFNK